MSKYVLLPADRILSNYQKHLSALRSGIINSSILETIVVNAYGSKMHFHELATITKPEPLQLLITPFDKSLISEMVKAINDSNIGVNPVDDGAGIRLNFPPLTEENKKRRVEELHKLKETARIEVRQARQDVIKDQKTLKENGEISEDELARFEKEVQEEVNNLNLEIDLLTKNKEAEIMKV